MMNDKPKMLKLKEAAALVDGLTVYRIRQWCINGELQHKMAGNKYLINKKIFLEFIGEKPL